MVDKKTGQLWLCRDRFGVKPLYYAIDQHVLYFASTVAALAKQLKLAPNLAYCQRGLRYWVYEDDSDIAPYENLKALLPGHYLKIDASLNIQIVRYYNLESRVAALRENLHQQNPKALIEQTFAHLQRAIGLRLRADVPVGVAISGGLDSSSIAALIADAALPVNGFTYGHPDNKKTEGPLVAQLAKKINLTMHYVDPNVSQFTQALFATLQAQQAPFPSASVIAQYLVYQRAHEMGLKVLLGGQGGDESFMGYRKYFSFSLQRLLQDKNYGSALYLMAQMLPLLLAEMPRWKSFWQHRLRYQNSSAQAYSNIRFPNTEPFSLTPTTDHIWQRQLQDVTRFSLPTLLRYEDRNSMANSIESRLPFMDYELVEFGIALPEALKLHKGYGKWVIREMMQNKIPNTIRKARYKRGFDVGLAHLMAQGLGENIRQALHERYAHIKKYLMPYTHIMDSFSDKQLQVRQQTFAEAMTLLWLGDITT
jgi:asparagine synthase (glutamine-hydrolysing)